MINEINKIKEVISQNNVDMNWCVVGSDVYIIISAYENCLPYSSINLNDDILDETIELIADFGFKEYQYNKIGEDEIMNLCGYISDIEKDYEVLIKTL